MLYVYIVELSMKTFYNLGALFYDIVPSDFSSFCNHFTEEERVGCFTLIES